MEVCACMTLEQAQLPAKTPGVSMACALKTRLPPCMVVWTLVCCEKADLPEECHQSKESAAYLGGRHLQLMSICSRCDGGCAVASERGGCTVRSAVNIHVCRALRVPASLPVLPALSQVTSDH